MSAPPTTGVALAARALRKEYGVGQSRVVALDGVDLDLAAARFTAVMGPSGSGKSTLLHCLAGLDRPTAGAVHIGDADLTRLDDRRLTRLRRDRIGFVFQKFNLLPTLTAEENIVLPLAIAGRRPDATWLRQVVAAVGLTDRLGHRPAELSGGQQQRVAVARALINRPWVIFADEPTGNLDSRSGAEVLRLLREAVDTLGQTVVMVTHDPAAAAHADRVVFLADGRLVDELHEPTVGDVRDALSRLDPAVAPAGR
ncbi:MULTISPECIES: ABC transporter ATP-binding protein [Micromonospora]|uniref:ABC transporter ATP-binding protein n=1 Tax=Micromonospora TaxID=1873 RepID=UPI0001C43824|nr:MULTISPECIES: ABC transporter ATP-binding protein [Micromonospora]ADU10451.1 ABC transporter related protein [Micromonospora sp. L5]MBC9006055.1 ABC transporter ATP-binding protein [Micromonospora aurantiaca]RNI06593.1 ABC transporter ATP-binding protein [Micromonospora aurantiaca]SCL24731.1 putative ABC transport system ATP-binding protein [Micromonospora aurantiaca]